MNLPHPIITSLNGAGLPGVLTEAVERAGMARFLEYAGDPHLPEAGPRVGMIGTRTPSRESAVAFEAMAGGLSSRGAVIVSGCAPGCDMAAHRGALSAGGNTVGAAPCGLGAINWGAWRQDFALREGAESLLLLSPFSRDKGMDRQTPVVRNRLTAALSEVMIVGEAEAKSGTYHCVRFAREFGVPIFLQEAERPDAALAALHRSLLNSGAVPFRREDAGDPGLADAILRAAAQWRTAQHEAARAQLNLFDE